MRIRLGDGLLPLNLLAILLMVAVIFLPSNILRIVLGFPFVLVFPGYALTAALYPRRVGIGGIERIALSLGLSIAVVSVIGLILNYMPWGVGLESLLWSIAVFIFITSGIAWFRQKELPKWERFSIEFHLTLLGWGGGIWNKALSIVLILAILGTIGMVSYTIAKPNMGQKFTEFYILKESEAADYPKKLVIGKEARVMLGIVNHEYETMSYRVTVSINGVMNSEAGPIMLEHGDKWEAELTFVPKVTGKNQTLEFLLYRNGDAGPYLEGLRLWIDVTN